MHVDKLIMKTQEVQMVLGENGFSREAESLHDVLVLLENCKCFAQIEADTAKNPQTKSVFKFERAQSDLLNYLVDGKTKEE